MARYSQDTLLQMDEAGDSTKNAKGTLDAIVGTLSKNKDLDKQGKSMLKMGKGMQDWYKKHKSFSPDQAKWIFKMSKMFK